MGSTFRSRLFVLAASTVAGFGLIGAGCSGDVTGSPDGPVASNTEESNSTSAVKEQGANVEIAQGATEEAAAAEKPTEDAKPQEKDAKSPEQEKKYTGPPSAMGGMGGPGGEGQGGRRQGGMMRGMERMLEQLNLTDAQKDKIKAIMEEATKQFQALRESQDAQQGSLREKFQQIRDATIKKIETVLTPEQRTKLKKLQEEAAAEMRERMREREQGRPGDPGPGGSSGGSGDRQGTRSSG